MGQTYLLFKKDGVQSGYACTPSVGLVVKPNYTATTETKVKFLHKGQDLYIGIQSDDKSVCKFDWEGDGMFFKIKPATGDAVEIKMFVILPTTGSAYLGLDPNSSILNTAGSIRAVAQLGAGTTLFDSTNVDGGYSAEAVIHLDKLGYAANATTIPFNAVWFDPQGYNLSDFANGGPGAWGIPGKNPGNFFKQWWGSEWGCDKSLTLMSTILPVEMTSFTASVNSGIASLKWTTATELNNKGFEIERSLDKVNFSKVAFVEGKGTTSKTNSYTYSDKIPAGKAYFYRLCQIDLDGTSKYSNVVEAKNVTPTQFAMSQNYPNPFNPSTNVKFDLPVNSKVTVQVFNLLGQVVATMANGQFDAGSHELSFNASKLSSGIYIYNIKAAGLDGSNFSLTRKMSLLK
jgi:hypothetical protein